MAVAVLFLTWIGPASADTASAPTIYGDEIADELGFKVESARESGKTEQAAALAWQLLRRLNEIWGPNQTHYLLIYLGIAEMWLSADEFEKADAVLKRAETELGESDWFDIAHPSIVFTRGMIALQKGDNQSAERQMRTAFLMNEKLGESKPIVRFDDCEHILFSRALRANGKLDEAKSRLLLAKNSERQCRAIEHLLE